MHLAVTIPAKKVCITPRRVAGPGSSSHSSYSAIYDILFCAEEELVEGQDKRVRHGKVYSQIADGSTTQGARRREMESVHVKYPTLIDGADYEMDLHEGLRGVR